MGVEGRRVEKGSLEKAREPMGAGFRFGSFSVFRKSERSGRSSGGKKFKDFGRGKRFWGGHESGAGGGSGHGRIR